MLVEKEKLATVLSVFFCFFKVEYVELLRYVIINCCCLLVEKEKLATVLSVFLRAPVVSAAAPKTLRYCHQQLTS